MKSEQAVLPNPCLEEEEEENGCEVQNLSTHHPVPQTCWNYFYLIASETGFVFICS
jgi:hypothetical protein